LGRIVSRVHEDRDRREERGADGDERVRAQAGHALAPLTLDADRGWSRR